MITHPTMAGAFAATVSTTGWIAGVGPLCWCCGEPAQYFKPQMRAQLWWCKPCETTWMSDIDTIASSST